MTHATIALIVAAVGAAVSVGTLVATAIKRGRAAARCAESASVVIKDGGEETFQLEASRAKRLKRVLAGVGH